MKRSNILTITGLLIALAAGTANAHASHRGWGHGHYDDYRQGELTRSERRLLKRMKHRINRLRHRFLDDGYLSKRERRILRKKRVQYKRMKYRLTHNDRYPHRRDHRWY